MSKITLTEKDNNKRIKAEVNDTLDIILPINPSTGFFWQATDTSAGKLERVQHDGVTSLPGASHNVRFRFTVLSKGNFTLHYARPWEELTPPTKMFDIEVEV